MANIIQFPSQKGQSGLKRVKKKTHVELKRTDQIDLFKEEGPQANIYIMPTDMTPFERALILDEKGDDGAKEAYEKALENEDCTADAYCNLGILEYEEGSTVKAINRFTLSLKADPRHFESHYNLANLYSELGNLPLAKTHYEFARELQPDFPDICFNLGIVYAMMRDYQSSVKVLSEYKEMVPKEEGENAERLIESIKKITG